MAVAISFLVGAGLVSLALAATPGASTWHVMKAARPLVDTTQLLWDNMKQFPSAAPTGMAAKTTLTRHGGITTTARHPQAEGLPPALTGIAMFCRLLRLFGIALFGHWRWNTKQAAE